MKFYENEKSVCVNDWLYNLTNDHIALELIREDPIKYSIIVKDIR